MTSICLYSSYSESNKIVYYIKVYLTELLRHVDRIVFITNQKELDDVIDFFEQHYFVLPE